MSSSHASDALTVAGLSSREAAVWSVLTKQGPMNVLAIARAVSLHRPAVYELLASLLAKELIESTTQTRRVLYRSRGVRVLEQWRAQRDKEFAKQLQQLGKHEEGERLSEDVRVYRGKEIRKVWETVLAYAPKGGVFYRYDAYKPGISVVSYQPKDYYPDLEKKRVDRFVITNASLRKAFYKKRLECASHVLPPMIDPFEQGITQFIFGDQVAFVDFTSETAYVFKNGPLADFQKKLFQCVYQHVEQKGSFV